MWNRPTTTNIHSEPCYACNSTGITSKPAKTTLTDKLSTLGVSIEYKTKGFCGYCEGSGEILTEQVESFSDAEWLSDLEERVKELECK